MTHYQVQNDEIILDAELVFKVESNGQLKLTEAARQDPIQGGELRTRSPEFALTFSQTLLRQGFANAIALVMRSSVQSTQQPEPEVLEPQEPNHKEQAEAMQPEIAPASPPHSSSTGKRPEEVLKILEFDPSYRQLHAQQGQASAQAYAQNTIAFAMKYHQGSSTCGESVVAAHESGAGDDAVREG